MKAVSFFSLSLCLATTSLVVVLSACSIAKEESTVKDSQGTENAEFAGEGNEQEKLINDKYQGCFEITKNERYTTKDTWGPDAEEKFLCTMKAAVTDGSDGFTPKGILFWGWDYLKDDKTRSGGAGGPVSAKIECEDCVGVYHLFMLHLHKVRPVKDGLEIQFYSLQTKDKDGNALAKPEFALVQFITLKKVEEMK